MSTPAGSGAADAKSGNRRMSLGKYVRRMSSVFKREKSSKAVGDYGALVAPSESAQQQNVEEGAVAVEATPAAPSATANPASPTTTVTVVANPPSPTVVTKQIDRHAMQQERARALFAKYGLTLDTHDWITGPAPVPTVQRVEKAIRMRVHRSCHRCGTTYGSEKQCLQCQHKRCNKCPWYPKKKMSFEQDKAADEKPKKKRVLTITARGGNELACQPVKQCVRRTCHKCESMFVPSSATSCEQCQHVRCTKCPREPAKLQKRPDGYPGDADAESDSEVEKQLEMFRRTWRKPRQRVRWQCEQCHRSFISGSPQCPGCGHERCEKCVRSPTKNTRKEEMFDPQLVAAVEAKLKALDVDTDALTSGVDVA